jgi:leucyl aminopeptidase (aminopeptidase T)
MESNKIIDAYRVANRIVGNYLGVKPGEEVFIIVDPETDMTMPLAIASAVQECHAEFTLAIMPTRGTEKATTCTDIIGKGMEAADVYISMTHSSGAAVYDKRLKALIDAKKIRECSMVMRDLDNYIKGGALADYEEVYREGQILTRFWAKRRHIKITSPAGTNLTAEIGHGTPFPECGIARNPGDSMAFSDGEVSQGPNKETVNGTLVIDGPICQMGLPCEPIVMTIKSSRIVSVNSGDPRIVSRIQKLINTVENADNIAEIGIGLNPASRLNGDFQEEKKARGTCHIALGDDLYYDGDHKCDVHIDMIMYKPTVIMDDIVVVEAGEVMIENLL